MTKNEFKRRLAALANQFKPEAQIIQVRLCTMEFVEDSDPRLGTWQCEERKESSAAAIDNVTFYCANHQHFREMCARFDRQPDQILFTVSEPKAPIFTTNVNCNEE